MFVIEEINVRIIGIVEIGRLSFLFIFENCLRTIFPQRRVDQIGVGGFICSNAIVRLTGLMKHFVQIVARLTFAREEFLRRNGRTRTKFAANQFQRRVRSVVDVRRCDEFRT